MLSNRAAALATVVTLLSLSACGGSSGGSSTASEQAPSGGTTAGNTGGSGGGSAPPDTTSPTVPAAVAASATDSTDVTVTWAGSTDPGGSGVGGYKVYRGGVAVASSVTGTSYTDSTVVASTSYSYTVSAVDVAGNESAQSPAAPVTTPAGNSQPPGPASYPGYTYTLPTQRPFISLTQYTRAGVNSTATMRLKAEVDDVVTVTASPQINTYSALINALSSNHYAYSSVDSVVMYELTGNTAYIDQAIRMVDLFVTSENALITAGSTPQIASDSYLNVGDLLEQLALAYDYGYARLTSTQRTNWSAYAQQTLTNLWNPSTASWGGHAAGWSGWAVDDPGDNYYYSFLKATQLWALASQDHNWISFLQTKKYTELVPYMSVLVGGGSREGTGYGTAMGSLFEDYAYWKDSTGEDLSGYSAHARDTIDYWVHATVPTFQYFAPIGDQSRSSMPTMFDYQRKLVLEGVGLSPTSAQGMRGAWWLARAQVTDGGNGWVTGSMRYNFDFRYDLINANATQQAPTALMYDATGTGALFARSDWSTTASWMHTNVGPYDQSHAHQDQGGFSFFRNTWLSITSNVYSNSGINQGTDVENVLRFDFGGNPVPQNNAVSTKTVSDSGDVLQIDANLTPAYSDNSGKVASWTRQFTYTRSQHTLSIHDKCAVGSGVTPVFQLHVPVAPVKQTDGSYLAGTLLIQPQLPVAANLTVSVVNMHTVSSDFAGGYRLELRGPANSCEFQVSLTAH